MDSFYDIRAFAWRHIPSSIKFGELHDQFHFLFAGKNKHGIRDLNSALWSGTPSRQAVTPQFPPKTLGGHVVGSSTFGLLGKCVCVCVCVFALTLFAERTLLPPSVLFFFFTFRECVLVAQGGSSHNAHQADLRRRAFLFLVAVCFCIFVHPKAWAWLWKYGPRLPSPSK